MSDSMSATAATAVMPAAAYAVVSPRPDRTSFTITDLSAEFGVTPRALRFYEDEGLIAPERRGMVRIYSHRDRARLAWILRGKRVGFSLADIREMIDLYDVGDGRQTQRLVAMERCRERIDALQQQKNDIDAAINELAEFLGVLEGAASKEK